MTFPLLNKIKTIKDPIHDTIIIRHQVILDLINTKEFQRLRFIRQLGGVFFIYPTAEHSRYCHSLGTYEIARKISESSNSFVASTNQDERLYFQIAALLHDLGHGPFSHAFEFFHSISHEQYTVQIINSDSEVNQVLAAIDPLLPQIICNIIEKKYHRIFLTQLISSQLDADRMDYLLRDAYFTGLPYGVFDINRIIMMIRIIDDQLSFSDSALSAIENFFTVRYHMYQQLYFHPTSISFEVFLSKWILRIFDLEKAGYQFINNYNELFTLKEEMQLTNEEHYSLIDSKLLNLLESTSQESDLILQDFFHRYKSRTFLSPMIIDTDHSTTSLKSKLSDIELRYYYSEIESNRILYKRRVHRNDLTLILVKDELHELSMISPIVKAIVDNPANKQILIFGPNYLGK